MKYLTADTVAASITVVKKVMLENCILLLVEFLNSGRNKEGLVIINLIVNVVDISRLQTVRNVNTFVFRFEGCKDRIRTMAQS